MTAGCVQELHGKAEQLLATSCQIAHSCQSLSKTSASSDAMGLGLDRRDPFSSTHSLSVGGTPSMRHRACVPPLAMQCSSLIAECNLRPNEVPICQETTELHWWCKAPAASSQPTKRDTRWGAQGRLPLSEVAMQCNAMTE